MIAEYDLDGLLKPAHPDRISRGYEVFHNQHPSTFYHRHRKCNPELYDPRAELWVKINDSEKQYDSSLSGEEELAGYKFFTDFGEKYFSIHQLLTYRIPKSDDLPF